MTPLHDAVAAVALHPRVLDLARSEEDAGLLGAFSRDVAAYLTGAPPEDLQPLARVVTAVAESELDAPRRLCEGRPLLAVEAAARLTEELWPLLRAAQAQESPPPPEPSTAPGSPTGTGGGQPGEEDGDDGGDTSGEGNDAPGGEGSQDPLEGLREALEASDQTRRAAEASCMGAIEVEQATRTLARYLPGIGWSTAPGVLERRLLANIARLATLLQRSATLRQLADALGRVEGAHRAEGHQDGGSEEVAGVRIGGDVRTALPSELGLLADEETELLFYQRLVEHRLVSLELVGSGLDGRSTAERRGPVVACIDTSGSMSGLPEVAAKALVLAVCRRVLPQGRAVHLLLFGGPGEQLELRLRRGSGGLDQALDFIAMVFDSGTDIDTPLRRALELVQTEPTFDRADVLVVTDGLCMASDDVIAALDEARTTHGTRVFGVVIGRTHLGRVKRFSDQVWRVDAQNPEAAAGLVRHLAR